MSNFPTINWTGQSGAAYTYYICPRGTQFSDNVPGNYIHAKETSPGKFVPVYIGQTKNLNERLSNHEKKACVDKHGATHVCVHANSQGEQARLDEEKDLILRWQPTCNSQHIR